MKRFATTLILSTFLSSGVLFGQTGTVPVKDESVRIEYQLQLPDEDLPKETQTKWAIGCKNLGDALSLGKGPYGFGAFSRYNCPVSKDMNAKKPKADPAPATPEGAAAAAAAAEESEGWQILITQSPIKFEIVVNRFLPPSKLTGQPVPQREITRMEMPPSEASVDLFLDKGFTDLVAYWVMQAVPMAMYVTQSSAENDGKAPRVLTGRDFYPTAVKEPNWLTPPPPEDLGLFGLTFDPFSTLWFPDVKGFAKLTGTPPPPESPPPPQADASKGIVAPPVVPKANHIAPVWELDAAAQQALKSNFLWAQNKKGPKDQTDVSIKAILGARQELLKQLSGRFPAYIALRFGIQTMKSENPLTKKLKMFGLMLENRADPLAGLRAYLDVAPKVTDTDAAGNVQSLSWWRLIVGKSFWKELNFPINRIDVVPKIGVWSFNADLATTSTVTEVATNGTETSTTTTTIQNFKVPYAPSFGLELGAERVTRKYSVRGWAAYDMSLAVGKEKSAVKTIRLGLDGHWAAPWLFSIAGVPMHIGVIGFGLYEIVSFTRTVSDEDIVEGVPAISGVGLKSGYVGTGLALSW